MTREEFPSVIGLRIKLYYIWSACKWKKKFLVMREPWMVFFFFLIAVSKMVCYSWCKLSRYSSLTRNISAYCAYSCLVVASCIVWRKLSILVHPHLNRGKSVGHVSWITRFRFLIGQYMQMPFTCNSGVVFIRHLGLMRLK